MHLHATIIQTHARPDYGEASGMSDLIHAKARAGLNLNPFPGPRT